VSIIGWILLGLIVFNLWSMLVAIIGAVVVLVVYHSLWAAAPRSSSPHRLMEATS